MAEMIKSAVPVFVMATVFVLLVATTMFPKESETGETLIAGAGELTPLPSKETDVGEVAALLEIVAVPLLDPAVCGLKVTLAV